ncbi:TonB family C-terminal domain-containing protein [Microbulbifer thermotolerans]|uniref:AgmX/PglI C-terminal domain-containing protein n=1 Tax=Microbulbifer thermotolerans TaxID=252514 RepID=A0AB35HYS2_MICTH|nr:AgmX/PglI C-terminal domain-containing protein [Microbulbifer thermotolerans]MCX2802692.1 AgmX/PglI C-terminal domain-containing protein [Microbulbifer thermotolerans]MCX2840682.1 AgmX/PglI C-terminal domain-containing protein [Microbulbifer thermotolerans]SFC88576.1 TonB family C-terminal domain-containing protein [Microbulbifer thermotolerans]
MSNFSQQQQAVSDELQIVRQRILALEEERQCIDAQLEALRGEGAKHQLLGEICDRLDQLEAAGAGALFWADDCSGETAEKILCRARQTICNYNSSLEQLQEQRRRVSDEIEICEDELCELDERAENLRREEEEAQFEFEITREYEAPAFRPMQMPWHTQGEDERRFRRCVLASLFVALLLGYLVPLWKLPEPENDEIVEIPERLAKLVIEKKTKPKPPEPEKLKPKVEEKKKKPEPKQEVAQQDPKPTKAEKKEARKRAERAGVLAFKDNFQDLIEDDLDNRLGPQTQLSTAGKKENRSQRSLITAAATAGSGGINTAEISRNAGGTGTALAGVAFSRVESSIGTEGDFAGEDRPLSDGVGPSRTDEEIQIVFDRYKASLYRIYNRELRENPALQGKMVLKITIEPDGSVSLVEVASSDMDSPSLDAKIVARVKRFNFGAKEGVPTITILYPIDFLPAA